MNQWELGVYEINSERGKMRVTIPRLTLVLHLSYTKTIPFIYAYSASLAPYWTEDHFYKTLYI